MSADDTATAETGQEPCDALRLDNQLCFGLYAAAHAMSRAYRLLLGEIGLTYPQYLTLLALWEADGQNVSELGQRLRLDSGTLTPVLKRMEGAGLVTRARSRRDEREVEVRLTERGRALQAEAVGVRAGVVCKLDMSEEEIMRLRNDIDRVIERLDGSPPERPRKG